MCFRFLDCNALFNMSVQYERMADELPQTDDYPEPERPEIFFMQVANVRGRKWPRAIGVVQIVIGVLIALLGRCIGLDKKKKLGGGDFVGFIISVIMLKTFYCCLF